MRTSGLSIHSRATESSGGAHSLYDHQKSQFDQDMALLQRFLGCTDSCIKKELAKVVTTPTPPTASPTGETDDAAASASPHDDAQKPEDVSEMVDWLKRETERLQASRLGQTGSGIRPDPVSLP